MHPIIISGSSRNDGNTTRVVEILSNHSGWKYIELNDYQFSYYDYQHRNRDDQFLPLMRNLIADYDTFIFATPVYWYSMSGIMKVFFDRISDLLTIEKPLGRKLRTKKMAGISASGGNDLEDLFWLPFRESAKYLGMDYLGDLHVKMNSDHDDLALGMEEEIIRFIEKLKIRYAQNHFRQHL
ncbi:MAG: NAD(P)H-dependent oxidoreductase [Saprospiraceae bacterium]|nr:NAD(P)H-dependent oxidoreductase [Saprospiraceae bacterium]